MFHVKHFKIHQILFFFFLLTLPFQTRIIYDSGSAYIGSVFNYHLAFILYLSDLVFLAALIDWLVFHKPQIVSRGTNLVRIIGFFGVIVATLFHVKHIELGLYEALKWFEMLVLLVYGWINFKDRRFIEVSLAVILFGGLIQAIVGILQFHVQHGLSLGFLGEYVSQLGTPGLATITTNANKLIRAYGTMPHPNVLGGFLYVSLITGYYFLSRETMFHRIRTIFVACATIILLLGIFVSFSRIAWLSAILVTIGYLWFHVKHKEWSKVIVIVIVTVVSCATILIGYKDLALSRGGETLSSNSVTLRGTYNEMGLELVKKYPVLGVGVGHYIPALRDFYQLEDWQYQPAHNIYIFLAAELGILGLGLFLIIVGSIIKRAWINKNQLLTFTLLLGVGSFLFIGLFDHYPLTIQQTRLTFFLLLGMLAAQANIQEAKNKIEVDTK